MAINDYCEACEALKEYGADFILNGVTDEICASLQRNEGINNNLNPLHSNCEDTQDIIDCLIGKLSDDLKAYGQCDWQEYAERFTDNTKAVLDVLACSICGLWAHVDTGGYKTLVEGVDYIVEFYNGFDRINDNWRVQVIETPTQFDFRISVDLYNADIKQALQNHGDTIANVPESRIYSIKFLNQYELSDGNNLADYLDSGGGTFNMTPKETGATWRAELNAEFDDSDKRMYITWRSYQNGFNRQISTDYPGANLVLNPGVTPYTFKYIRPYSLSL